MKISQNTNQKKIFSKHMQEKLAVTVLVITLALFALVAVLYNITKHKQEDFTQIVLSQQQYDSRILPYRRGDIVDRNGTYLATSEKVYNLIVDPKQIMSDEEDFLETTVTALSEVYGYDKTELAAMIRDNRGKAYIRYVKQLTYDQKESFETAAKDVNEANQKSGSTARVKGIWFEDEYKRIYPNNSMACDMVGFALGDGVEGSGGVEQYYNSTLIGTNGREYGYLNDESNLERVIKPAINGNTVMTAIDLNIQNIVEKHINQWTQETGSKMTGVVVMDPNTAEVLAMANSSQFDLNNPRDLNGLYTQEEQAAMDEEAKAEVWNQIWRNYCVSDTFEPGSPSKVFTLASAIEEGIITGNETLVCEGSLEIGGWPIKCVKRTGHGPLTVTESLMQSCNVAMMQLAQKQGKTRFYKYFENFGFGTKTEIDLPGEANTSPLVYNEVNAGPVDLATNSFGQNYNCTMIQMAAAYCAAINGGSYYTPHVMKQVLNEQGSVVSKSEPKLVREVMSESTSAFIRQALFKTVSEGTGKAAQIPGYHVGGKTGTAEKYPRKQNNYIVSFIGFAPVDDPQILVYVVIDEPNVEDQAHSSFASSLFQKITAEILPYLNVFPTAEIRNLPNGGVGQLPQEEGITSFPEGGIQEGEAQEGEPTPETKVYETDEYVETVQSDGGAGDALPGVLPTASVAEAEESQAPIP